MITGFIWTVCCFDASISMWAPFEDEDYFIGQLHIRLNRNLTSTFNPTPPKDIRTCFGEVQGFATLGAKEAVVVGGLVPCSRAQCQAIASLIWYQQPSSCHLTSHRFLARLSDCWGTGKSPSYNKLALSTPLYVYFHGEPWNLFLAAQVFVWKEIFLSNPAGKSHNYLNREWHKPQKQWT